MTKEIRGKDRVLYQCEECGFKYAKAEIARQCEQWCREHHSCNLEIIKDAVQE